MANTNTYPDPANFALARSARTPQSPTARRHEPQVGAGDRIVRRRDRADAEPERLHPSEDLARVDLGEEVRVHALLQRVLHVIGPCDAREVHGAVLREIRTAFPVPSAGALHLAASHARIVWVESKLVIQHREGSDGAEFGKRAA